MTLRPVNRYLIAAASVIMLLSLQACSAAQSSGPTSSVEPLSTAVVVDCSDVAVKGQALLDITAKWKASSAAIDQAITDNLHGADYQVVVDANAKHDALTEQFTSAQIEWSTSKSTHAACADLITAHKNLETAHDLKDHDSVGAAGKLAAAQKQWDALHAAAL